MQSSVAPGDYLRVRGRLWRLRGKALHADCCELDLEPVDADLKTGRRVLLAPFDRPVCESRVRPLRIVRRRAWMHAFLEAIARERRCDRLHAPATAAIDLLPFQLEPLIAVVRHGAPRVLLADAVGLGKTIQAGLVLAELLARRDLERAIVLTPPGLRDQWAGELRDRFGLDAVIADAAWLRTARADLPTSVNPWSVPSLVIASLDFIKRPEVQAGLEDLTWDVLIVDEAHLATRDSERRAAAHAIGLRSRHVLLLTATPHAGDPTGYDALCGIGAIAPDEPVAIFRRTRGDAGFAATRHVHTLPVRLTEGERQLHTRLLAYVRRVWERRSDDAGQDSRLSMIVLLKRALSNATSLGRSLEFRLSRLGDTSCSRCAQLILPLEGETDTADEAHTDVLAAPGLEDAGAEHLILADLGDAARAVSASDSKTRVLRRLVERVREPCVVFTEYRDTLAAIDAALSPQVTRAVLHGGLDRAARRIAIEQFESGAARVLLATDAAGEGLNLQRRCRLVVNLELPWNPVRLEQRIGRVDRLGQRRTVHAVNLVAAGTHESSLLTRLACRLERVRFSLGAADDVLGPAGDMVIADAVVGAGGSDVEPLWKPWQSPAPTPRGAVPAERLDLGDAASLHYAQLVEERALWQLLTHRRPTRGNGGHGSGARDGSLPIATAPARQLGEPLRQPGLLAVFSARASDTRGRSVDEMLVPVFVPCPVPVARTPHDVRAALAALPQGLRSALSDTARAIAGRRLTEIACDRRRTQGRALARELVIYHATLSRPVVFQPGLFDRRTEREAERLAHAGTDQRTGSSAHAELILAPHGERPAADPELVLLLLVTP